MLILAGVAFREAGVLVRLLLLGVMPLKTMISVSFYSLTNIHIIIVSLLPGTGS